jgi:hypothetical protein
MTAKAIRFVISAVFACVASAQTTPGPFVTKVFQFTYTDTPRGMQEIVNTMRSVAEVEQVTVDTAARSMTLVGTADQFALAGWLLPQLDLPAQPPSQPSPSPATLEYRLAGSGDAVVHVFYLTHTPTPQGMQEIINTVRSIIEVQRVMANNALQAVVLRGTAAQVAASEWLINGLDKAAGMQPVSSQGQSSTLAYTLADVSVDPRYQAPAVRVFYLAHTPNPQGMQEIVNSVRSLGEIQRVVSCNGPMAIAVRGTADQAAMAAWLIDALDKPAGVAAASPGQTPAVIQYQLAGSGDLARVFYPHTSTPQELQDLVNQIRSTVGIKTAVPYNATGALALRGTVGQVAMAEKLIH